MPVDEEEQLAPVRPGFQETLRNASDLALLGIATAIASLGVVTAGAAVATASAAVHDWAEFGSWPGFRANLRRFGRALLPGIPATLVALGVTALMIIDLSAVSRGVVPGGTVLTAATGLLILAVGGFAGLVVVAIGRRGGEGWIPSVRAAFQLAQGKPTTLVACAGITGLTILLSVMIMPILTPILAGYTVLALHAAVRRLGNPDF